MLLELPITNDSAQDFITQLGDTKYSFYIKYNDVSGVWTADIGNPVTGEIYLAGLALTTGVNLLEPYNLPLTNLALIDRGLAIASAPITPGDMGVRLRLYWWDGEDE